MAKTKKPLSAASKKKRIKELLAKRIKAREATPKPEPSPELRALMSRLEAMEKVLARHKAVKVTGSVEQTPMFAQSIRKWEKQLGGPAPADFREFLEHQGPFLLQWKFKKRHPELGSGPVGSFDIVFPVKHPMARVDGFENLWLFWRDDHRQYAWKAGTTPQLMLENLDDDSILTPKPSFTQMLADQIEWYGAKGTVHNILSSDQVASIPVVDGLRDFDAIEQTLFRGAE
jgi:hypothetical protein